MLPKASQKLHGHEVHTIPQRIKWTEIGQRWQISENISKITFPVGKEWETYILYIPQELRELEIIRQKASSQKLCGWRYSKDKGRIEKLLWDGRPRCPHNTLMEGTSYKELGQKNLTHCINSNKKGTGITKILWEVRRNSKS